MPQLMQLVDPQQEQLAHELTPSDAAASPSKEASVTSITSMSSISLNMSAIFHPSFCFFLA